MLLCGLSRSTVKQVAISIHPLFGHWRFPKDYPSPPCLALVLPVWTRSSRVAGPTYLVYPAICKGQRAVILLSISHDGWLRIGGSILGIWIKGWW